MSGTEMSQKKTTNSTLLKLSILCVAALNNVMGSATSVLGSIASVFPDASYQVVAMISTIPPLLMSVVPFFYTPLITHVKKRTVLWIASVLLLVGGLGPAVLHDNIYVILGFRIILGFAVGLTTVLSIDLIMDFFDGKEQNTLTGFRDTFNSIGGAIFMLLGGWLAGFQWYFCFLAVIVGIVFIAIPLAALPEPDRNAKIELEKEKIGADKVDVKIPAGVWVFSIFTLLHWAFFYVFITNVSLIVVSEGIASPAQCGIIYAFTNVGTIIFGLIFGKVFEKVKFVTFLIGMLRFGAVPGGDVYDGSDVLPGFGAPRRGYGLLHAHSLREEQHAGSVQERFQGRLYRELHDRRGWVHLPVRVRGFRTRRQRAVHLGGSALRDLRRGRSGPGARHQAKGQLRPVQLRREGGIGAISS